MSKLSIILMASCDNPVVSENFLLNCGRQEGPAASSMGDIFPAGLVVSEAFCFKEVTEA